MLMRLDSIEEQALFSTVRIESLDSSRNPISVGTGFIICLLYTSDAADEL